MRQDGVAEQRVNRELSQRSFTLVSLPFLQAPAVLVGYEQPAMKFNNSAFSTFQNKNKLGQKSIQKFLKVLESREMRRSTY